MILGVSHSECFFIHGQYIVRYVFQESMLGMSAMFGGISIKTQAPFWMAETQTLLREASNALMPEMLEHR